MTSGTASRRARAARTAPPPSTPGLAAPPAAPPQPPPPPAAAPLEAAQLATLVAQAVADALASVLQQVAVRPLRRCAHCVQAQLQWAAAHAADIAAARGKAFRQARLGETTLHALLEAGLIGEGDPRVAAVDWTVCLPEHLRPGGAQAMPPVFDAVTVLGGTEVCQQHLPGGVGRPLLTAVGSLHAAAAQAIRGAPGMPGAVDPMYVAAR